MPTFVSLVHLAFLILLPNAINKDTRIISLPNNLPLCFTDSMKLMFCSLKKKEKKESETSVSQIDPFNSSTSTPSSIHTNSINLSNLVTIRPQQSTLFN